MKATAQVPLENFTDLLLDAICVVDRDGNFLYVSAASEKIFGYRPDEMIGRNMITFIHPGDRKRTLNAVNEIMAGEPKPHFENRYVRKDGSTAHIMWSARWSESDRVRVAVARDVTERKHAESLQAAIYAISDAANILGDLEGLFQRIHQVVDDLLCATNFVVAVYDAQMQGLDFPYQAHPFRSAPHVEALISSLLTDRVIHAGQSLLLTSDDLLSQFNEPISPDIANWLAVPIKSQNEVFGALLVLSSADHMRFSEQDMELLQFVAAQVATAMERKKIVLRLEHMAQYDQLTDLPNRTLFLDRLQTALRKAHRSRTRLAVLYLDLDKFKQVNDTYGHIVGDRLLQEVARRLTGCIRESDTVSRLGGDEFVVLLENIRQSGDVERVAGKIHLALSARYDFPGASFQIFTSIGTALYPDNGTSELELMSYADNAMYKTKKMSLSAEDGPRPPEGAGITDQALIRG
ncbi:diguanylate cyclase domain-containing protein [Marinobacterium aestuariivivens]|uniref:Diguanylate cyclase domain-containing protein n=1 Tax=Marinobacterium aestuariivivens TaxID=1698799 RepID=A0ABW2A3E5_9GAMM